MPSPNAPWARLFNDVKISVPGVTDAVQQQETFRCVKDFFAETNLWTENVTLTLVPDEWSYPFTLAGKGVPHRLMMVYDPNASPPNRPRWVSYGAVMDPPGTISLQTIPTAPGSLVAIVAKTITDPTDDNNYPELDPTIEWAIDKYREALYRGIMAYIQSEPAKPYTNAKAAADNMVNYISKRSQARADGTKGNVYGAQRWAFPQGFATVRRQQGA